MLRGDINISSVRIMSPKVRVILSKEQLSTAEEKEKVPLKNQEENWIEILKEAFGKIPVKYLELKDARFSVHQMKNVYRFSDVNFYALQLSRVVNFQAQGFFSDTSHQPFFFNLKTKLDKEALDLSGQVDVRKVVLSKLALPSAIKGKVAFFEHPISLSFLYNFYPKTTDFYLNGKVRFYLPQNKSPVVFSVKAEKKKESRLSIFLSTPKVHRKDLVHIWYPHEDNVRPWVLRAVSAGIVEDFSLDLFFEKKDQSYDLYDVQGKMKLVDTTIKYMRDLPAVQGIYGALHFDKEALWGIVHRAHYKNVIISKTELKISGLDDTDHMHFDGGLFFEGLFKDLIEYLNHGFFKKHLPKDMRVKDGNVDGHFHLSIPLKKDAPSNEIIFEAGMNLKNGALSLTHQGQTLHLYDTSLAFKKSHELMHLKGKGAIDGFKSEFLIEENYRNDASIVSKKKVQGAGRIKGLWEMLPGALQAQFQAEKDGQVSLSFYSEKDKGGVEKIDIDLDLQKTGLTLPLFNWHKIKGAPGKFELDLETKSGVIRKFKKLSFVAPGAKIIGNAEFGQDGKISGINLSPFQVGEKKGEARAEIRDGIWNVFIRMPFLNFNPILASFRRGEPADEEEPGKLSLNLDIRINDLFLKEAHRFNDVHALIKLRDGDFHFVNVKGKDKEETLSLRYQPHKGNMVLEVDVPKLETILDGLDITQNMRAQNIQIQAQKPLKNMAQPLKGKLFVESIHILKAPVFAKLLRLISIEGLLQSLAGEGIVFNDNYAKFEYKNKNIAIRRAYMMNSSIGITAKGYLHLGKKNMNIEGVLVPANFINQLLGKIPLIGQLLTGGKDQGLFSVSYTAKGSIKEPDISSNPLGVIAPNFIKGLFSKHEKPALTESGQDATKL